MSMSIQCKKCGQHWLCEDCAFDAYSGGCVDHLNISSGEDVCLNEDGNYSYREEESSDSSPSQHAKEKKSHEATTITVKRIPDREVLHE